MNKKSVWISLLFLTVFFSAAYLWLSTRSPAPLIDFEQRDPVAAYRWDPQGKTLKVAMISVLSRQETYRYQRQVLNAIGTKMGQNVLLLQRSSYAEIIQLLANGGADAALLSTGAYGVYGHQGNFVPLVMQQRNGSSSYRGLIIVSKDSQAKVLQNLKGKTFAFVDPLSYSGHLSVINELQKSGENAETFFGLSYFTFSNDKSLRAVAEKLVDGAAINLLVYDYYKRKQPELLEKIRIIAELSPAGTGPIVVRSDYPDKEKLKRILLRLHEDPSIASSLNELMIDRFVEARTALFPVLKPLIDRNAK